MTASIIMVNNGIVSCNINAYSTVLDELGIDDSFWIKYAFNVSDILYIREDVDDSGNICAENCILMLKGDTVVSLIDIPYVEVLEYWINSK